MKLDRKDCIAPAPPTLGSLSAGEVFTTSGYSGVFIKTHGGDGSTNAKPTAIGSDGDVYFMPLETLVTRKPNSVLTVA